MSNEELKLDILYNYSSPDYSQLDFKLKKANKKLYWAIGETTVGAGLLIGSLFIPDNKSTTSGVVNVTSEGENLANVKFSDSKTHTNPWKIGMATAGTLLLLDGALVKIPNAIKLNNSVRADLKLYPTGVGFGIKF